MCIPRLEIYTEEDKTEAARAARPVNMSNRTLVTPVSSVPAGIQLVTSRDGRASDRFEFVVGRPRDSKNSVSGCSSSSSSSSSSTSPTSTSEKKSNDNDGKRKVSDNVVKYQYPSAYARRPSNRLNVGHFRDQTQLLRPLTASEVQNLARDCPQAFQNAKVVDLGDCLSDAGSGVCSQCACEKCAKKEKSEKAEKKKEKSKSKKEKTKEKKDKKKDKEKEGEDSGVEIDWSKDAGGKDDSGGKGNWESNNNLGGGEGGWGNNDTSGGGGGGWGSNNTSGGGAGDWSVGNDNKPSGGGGDWANDTKTSGGGGDEWGNKNNSGDDWNKTSDGVEDWGKDSKKEKGSWDVDNSAGDWNKTNNDDDWGNKKDKKNKNKSKNKKDDGAWDNGEKSSAEWSFNNDKKKDQSDDNQKEPSDADVGWDDAWGGKAVAKKKKKPGDGGGWGTDWAKDESDDSSNAGKSKKGKGQKQDQGGKGKKGNKGNKTDDEKDGKSNKKGDNNKAGKEVARSGQAKGKKEQDLKKNEVCVTHGHHHHHHHHSHQCRCQCDVASKGNAKGNVENGKKCYACRISHSTPIDSLHSPESKERRRTENPKIEIAIRPPECTCRAAKTAGKDNDSSSIMTCTTCFLRQQTPKRYVQDVKGGWFRKLPNISKANASPDHFEGSDGNYYKPILESQVPPYVVRMKAHLLSSPLKTPIERRRYVLDTPPARPPSPPRSAIANFLKNFRRPPSDVSSESNATWTPNPKRPQGDRKSSAGLAWLSGWGRAHRRKHPNRNAARRRERDQRAPDTPSPVFYDRHMISPYREDYRDYSDDGGSRRGYGRKRNSA